MIARLRAALQRRRDEKAKARRIAHALLEFAQFDAELRGLASRKEADR